MKRVLSIFTVFVLTMLLSTPQMMAGNDKRRGTAGAPELMINPWARSSGWGGVNVANARGLDAMFNNVAGLAFVESTEFAYTNTIWMGGKNGLVSGAGINTFGLARRVGEAGVLGAYVMAMGFGDIDVTTVESPEPGANGTFSPTVMNLNIAYAHSFTNTIHGGVVIKVISESMSDVSASGIGLDAGIQYVTGENDQFKFGISLKNIGPSMSFGGTGESFSITNEHGNPMTVEFREADIELPTCMNMGASYDFFFEQWNQRITVAATFTSNAFSRDNFILGAEYSLLDRFQVRAAYTYQTGLFDADTRATANKGLALGASVEFPLSKENNTSVVLDYSYRDQSPMKGSHAIGASIKF